MKQKTKEEEQKTVGENIVTLCGKAVSMTKILPLLLVFNVKAGSIDFQREILIYTFYFDV